MGSEWSLKEWKSWQNRISSRNLVMFFFTRSQSLVFFVTFLSFVFDSWVFLAFSHREVSVSDYLLLSKGHLDVSGSLGFTIRAYSIKYRRLVLVDNYLHKIYEKQNNFLLFILSLNSKMGLVFILCSQKQNLLMPENTEWNEEHVA